MISSGSLSSAPISSLAPLLPDVSASLAWLPHGPVVLTQVWLRNRPMRSYVVINLDPIVNPPPPTAYAAHVTFPGQAPRRTLPTAERLFYVTGSPFLGTSLRNFVTAPARLLRPTRAQGFQTFEIGGVLDVPKIGGWRPRHPDGLRLRQRPALGQSVWIVDPTTLLNAAPCVELGDETLTNPILADEIFTSPAFASETLTQPTLGSEDLC